MNQEESECGVLEECNGHLPRPLRTGKVRRAPNAFMLFVRDYRKRFISEYPKETPKGISILLDKTWRSIPEEEKQGYYYLAKKLAAMQSGINPDPDYCYIPMKVPIEKTKKGTEQSSKAEQENNRSLSLEVDIGEEGDDEKEQECSYFTPLTDGNHHSVSITNENTKQNDCNGEYKYLENKSCKGAMNNPLQPFNNIKETLSRPLCKRNNMITALARGPLGTMGNSGQCRAIHRSRFHCPMKKHQVALGTGYPISGNRFSHPPHPYHHYHHHHHPLSHGVPHRDYEMYEGHGHLRGQSHPCVRLQPYYPSPYPYAAMCDDMNYYPMFHNVPGGHRSCGNLPENYPGHSTYPRLPLYPDCDRNDAQNGLCMFPGNHGQKDSSDKTRPLQSVPAFTKESTPDPVNFSPTAVETLDTELTPDPAKSSPTVVETLATESTPDPATSLPQAEEILGVEPDTDPLEETSEFESGSVSETSYEYSSSDEGIIDIEN